jgi:molecular chaperone DnaK (HSP70)
VTIEVPFIISTGTSEPLHLTRTIDRSKFEELTEDLVDRTIQLAKGALAEAGVEPTSVDAVLLVGGMGRVPRVQKALTDLFGRQPMGGVIPEEALGHRCGPARCGAVADPFGEHHVRAEPASPGRARWGAARCSA